MKKEAIGAAKIITTQAGNNEEQLNLNKKNEQLKSEIAKEKKKAKVRKTVRKYVLIGIVIVIIALLVIKVVTDIQAEMNNPYYDLSYEDLSDNLLPDNSEETQKFLEKTPLLTIRMLSTAIFENGRSAGKISLKNVNDYALKVEFYLVNEKGEKTLVYQPGLLKPGDEIECDTLDVNLPKGVYNALARTIAFKPSDEVEGKFLKLGETKCEFKIAVLNTVP